MITLDYIWEQYEAKGYLCGEDHDEFSGVARRVANAHGVCLARFAFLEHGEPEPQVWAPCTKDGKGGWDWIYGVEIEGSSLYYERPECQEQLGWLLQILDIPFPGGLLKVPTF
jgi:hypothetical protein